MTVGFIPNLHIICPDKDGAVYIPTGKSLVRQLMATGLHTATKRMQLGKDILLQASIVGDQRYIKITSDVCKLFMDSGMPDFGNIGYLHPDFKGADGKLILGTAQQGEKIYLGYLNGNLTNTHDLPLEGAAAEAYKAKVYPEGHPQEGQRDPGSEELLVLKKICSMWIPPSTFTGKMRLYIQSLYGAKLEDWKCRPNAGNQPFSLDYEAPMPHGETITYHFHPVNTGLYLDGNMNHWLIQLGLRAGYAGTDNICITPMKSSECGEKLRKELRKRTPGTAEFEKIEAYILSQSYPIPYEFQSPNYVINIPCEGLSGNGGGIAYGWHFNWDGNKSDVVTVTTNWLGGDVYDYTSNHRRVDITRADSAIDPYVYNEELTVEENYKKAYDEEVGRWRGALSTIETVAHWRNSKWIDVIATPEWSEGTLSIFGTLLGGSYSSNAPFYCFYTRNELHVLRHTRTGGQALVERMRHSSPVYFCGYADWSTTFGGGIICAANTMGYESAITESRSRVETPAVSIFEDDATTNGYKLEYSSQAYTFGRITISGKSYISSAYYSPTYLPGDTYNVTVGTPGVVQDNEWGCSHSDGVYAETVTISGSQNIYAGFYDTVGYTGTSTSGSHNEYVKTVCVIPFGDAEAVYIYGDRTVAERATGGSGYNTTSGYSTHDRTDNEGVLSPKYFMHDSAYGSGSDPITDDDDEFESHAKCISNAGVHDFEHKGFIVSAFFAGEPNSSVQQNFWTRTSAGIDPALSGAGIKIEKGYSKFGHVFLGWA